MRATFVPIVRSRRFWTQQLCAYLKASREGPVIVTRHGKPVAVLLSVEDEEELERLILAYSPKLRAILDRARQQIQETGGIQQEDLWREVETAT